MTDKSDPFFMVGFLAETLKQQHDPVKLATFAQAYFATHTTEELLTFANSAAVAEVQSVRQLVLNEAKRRRSVRP
jgi:hypothetical protein